MVKDDARQSPSDLPLLLPFYVNGTLTEADRVRIEAALATDPELAAELEAVRALAGLVRRAGAALAPDLGTAGPKPVRDLSAWAAAGARRPHVSRLRPPQWVWKPALAAAVAVIVVQAGLLAYGPRTYQGLAGPAAVERAEAAPRIIVRLSPAARWDQVEKLFADAGLVIVGGPRGGAVDLEVTRGRPEAAIQRLRASALVLFAAPAA